MDTLGIVLAILYWLSLIAIVASVPIMMLIALTTMLDNPELMEQINSDPETREQFNQMLIQLRDMIQSS